MTRPAFDLSLYLVTDRPLCKGRDLVAVVAQAVKGGATMVQIREKTADTRKFLDLAKGLKNLLSPLEIPLLINDRIDVALAAGADGVHLGQTDMPCAEARAILGPDTLIGLSIDEPSQLGEAENLDVDYLGIGPVFATSTKADAGPALGLDTLRGCCNNTRHSVVGIGAITRENAGKVIQAGARGVAVVSAICAADSPRDAAKSLRRAVDRELGTRG